MKVPILSLCLAALCLPAMAGPRQNVPPPVRGDAGFRADFNLQLTEVEEKIVRLAEATPADRFTWRPAGDIRSISEVYMHIAGWNYYLSSFIGANPRGHGADTEKRVTRKEDVLAELRKSFDYLRAAVNNASDLEKPVKMMGLATTHRGVMMTMLNHLHEHLGQSIAYARMNGVVPPWSH